MPATLAPVAPAATGARRLRPVAIAVATAVVANAAVTTATDQLLHVLSVYPPWGEPMYDPALDALALGYRTVYGVLGAYLAAGLAVRLAAGGRAGGASDRPAPAGVAARAGVGMRAALAYGAVGLVLSALGAWVAITRYDLGPAWYPLLLATEALPVAWLGGALYRRRQRPAAGTAPVRKREG